MRTSPVVAGTEPEGRPPESRHPYLGRTAVLATMHGKLPLIAPAMLTTMGLQVVGVAVDTDHLGTFSANVTSGDEPCPPTGTPTSKPICAHITAPLAARSSPPTHTASPNDWQPAAQRARHRAGVSSGSNSESPANSAVAPYKCPTPTSTAVRLAKVAPTCWRMRMVLAARTSPSSEISAWTSPLRMLATGRSPNLSIAYPCGGTPWSDRHRSRARATPLGTPWSRRSFRPGALGSSPASSRAAWSKPFTSWTEVGSDDHAMPRPVRRSDFGSSVGSTTFASWSIVQ